MSKYDGCSAQPPVNYVCNYPLTPTSATVGSDGSFGSLTLAF